MSSSSPRTLGAADLALLESVFEGLGDAPFFVKDASLRYVAANAAMARLCGLPRAADLTGRTARDVFPAALAARYEALDRAVLADGVPVRDRLDLSRDAEGRPAWLLFSRVPVRDAAGAVVGIAAAARRLPSPVAPDSEANESGADRSGVHGAYARLSRVAERLVREFDQPLRLAPLAAEAGVSRAQLLRDFKRLFGVTPGGFQQRLRMEHARRLLREGGPVAQVALACGYGDQSAFSRRFLTAFGQTPSRWRRAALGDPAPKPPGR